MGQVLHGSATTTEAIRRAIQHSKESLRALSRRYGINQKTVRKWKARSSVVDRRTGPKEPRSTVLSIEEEAVIVGFRRHTLLPLDDCLYSLLPTIPHLTLSATAWDRPPCSDRKGRAGKEKVHVLPPGSQVFRARAYALCRRTEARSRELLRGPDRATDRS